MKQTSESVTSRKDPDNKQFKMTKQNHYQIPFNKPSLIGNELQYIEQAVRLGKLSGNGEFTRKCHEFFKQRYGYKKVLLTTSGTDALEMISLLIDTRPGDEIILPSYTFVSTANAFALRGAKLIFADSARTSPNIDVSSIEALISEQTKAIVIVHYAGIACDMDALMKLAEKHHLFLIEDAAQAIDARYKDKPLGSLGHFAAFSFHETKNVISGEGGMLVVNDQNYAERSEIIWEKGTNRSAFYRGEVDKYGWVDIGSSFLPSEMIAAFLYAQIEKLDQIQARRRFIWNKYFNGLQPLLEEDRVALPVIPEYASNNAHLFYIVCKNPDERTELIQHLGKNGVLAVFHYLSLHQSPYYRDKHDGRDLAMSDHYSDCLLRLPLFYDLQDDEIDYIIELITRFYKSG